MAALLKFVLLLSLVGIAYGLPCNRGHGHHHCGNRGGYGVSRTISPIVTVGTEYIGDGYDNYGGNDGLGSCGSCGGNDGYGSHGGYGGYSGYGGYGGCGGCGVCDMCATAVPLTMGCHSTVDNYDTTLITNPSTFIPGNSDCDSTLGTGDILGSDFDSGLCSCTAPTRIVSNPCSSQTIFDPLPPTNTLATTSATVESVATATTRPHHHRSCRPNSHSSSEAVSSSQSVSTSSSGAELGNCGYGGSTGTSSASASASASSSSDA